MRATEERCLLQDKHTLLCLHSSAVKLIYSMDNQDDDVIDCKHNEEYNPGEEVDQLPGAADR